MEYQEMLKRALERLPKRKSVKSRFKVPEPVCEYRGQRTVIRNFVEIAKALRRSQKHLAKFFLKELAAAGWIEGNSLVVQRKVLKDFVKKKLQEYLKEFVYCKECGEPDTVFEENDFIFIKCEACGARYPARKI